MSSTISGRNALRQEINLNWDGGDPWGSVLSNLGGLCDVVHSNGGAIPLEVEYRPAVSGADLEDYPSSEFSEMLHDGCMSMADCEYWIQVLDRYADLVPEDRRY